MPVRVSIDPESVRASQPSGQHSRRGAPRKPSRCPSGPGSLQKQLHLTHCGPADMEDGPAGSQNDRSGNKQNPEIHGGQIKAI